MCGHVGCVAQVEKESISLTKEADLDKGYLIASFFKKEEGYCSYAVRGPGLKFHLASDPMGLFSQYLQVICHSIVFGKYLSLLGIRTYC